MKRVVALALLAGALALPTQAWAAEAGAVFTEAAEGSVTLSSAGGCRTVDIPKVGKDIFGFVVYKFHHVKHWCWTYPRITSMTVFTYVSDVDPNMEYRGVIGSKSYFFTWCCRSGTSGHYSLRQAKFENCVLWFPCTRVEYPWVRITARGDGSYSWARGT